MHEETYSIHGLGLSVRTDDPRFSEYVSRNLSIFRSKTKEKALEVVYTLHRGTRYMIEPGEEMSRIGGQIWRGENSVLWRSRGLEVLASLLDEGMNIECHYHTGETNRGWIRRLADRVRRRSPARNRAQEICHFAARYSIHLPLFWMLGRTRGFGLLHASSVATEDRALVFTGLNNCGKSTLAASLSIGKGWKQLNENFTPVDERRAYAYPENRRISGDMIDSLPLVADGKEAYGKIHFPSEDEGVPMSAAVESVFFLSIGNRTEIRGIDPDTSLRMIHSINDYIHEFPEYSYLRFLRGQEDSTYENPPFEKLLNSSRQYLLTQSSSADLEKTHRLLERTLADES
jgi:hypothetical protein